MRIISLQLYNFRQFYGKTPIISLASGERNTTIIHGNNGAGKTTILNAFTWVLYNKFTSAFAASDLLVNKKALAEANMGERSIECSVEIEFEHEAIRYRVRRRCFAYRNQNNNLQYTTPELYMDFAGDDGRWEKPHESPEEVIENILPSSLHKYFFFDGEHIDHLSRSEQKSNLAEDTKELIGIKVLIRALSHLKQAKKRLQEELAEIGDIKLKNLSKKQSKLEETCQVHEQYIREITDSLAENEQLKRHLNEEFLKVNGIEDIQAKKMELEAREAKLRENLKEINQKIKKIISSQGFTIFLSEGFNKFYVILDDLRKKGELPSGIKQNFVEDLLNRQECICGQELHQESEAYQKVKAWMNKAGIAEIEETAIRLETQIQNIEQSRGEFWRNLDQYQGQLNQARQELSKIETQLDDVKEKLRRYPKEDIKNLQQNLDQVESKIREQNIELGATQQKLAIARQEIATNEKELQKHQVKEEKQALAKRRIEATKEVIERVEAVKILMERQFRLSLEERIQEIFSEISFTPYIPRINENYELQLVENTSGVAKPVAASTGENQILSLSFIGGIIDRVREWRKQNTLMGPNSSTFPIVMDSPFGSLDEIYRRQVAKLIPQLANQLIVLVTKTQWRGEVEQEMGDRIGKQYVLTYHSPKPDCEEDSININHQNIPLVKRSVNEFEYTEVVEVDLS